MSNPRFGIADEILGVTAVLVSPVLKSTQETRKPKGTGLNPLRMKSWCDLLTDWICRIHDRQEPRAAWIS